MKSFLTYGKREKIVPWFNGYRINSDGSSDIQISGVNIYEIADPEKDICWFHLLDAEKVNLLSKQELYESAFLEDPRSYDYEPCAFFYQYIDRLWDKLLSYCSSRSEKNFLEMYFQLCWQAEGTGATGDMPALFPQAFVNWNCDRLERQKGTEPYIVDFVCKHKDFGNHNLTIIEIDGPSHFADYENRKYTVSEEKYAEHLRKDRWLRRNGFNVIRIGNHEIEEIMKLEEKEKFKSFYYFFREVFGPIIWLEGFDDF